MSDETYDAELPTRQMDVQDLTAPVYADTPESQVQPSVSMDDDDVTEIQAQDYDLFEVLHRIENKVDKQGETLSALTAGVNTIGEMMNSVAELFDQMMKKVQSGGIAGLLGGMMGGKNGD